MVHSPPAYPGTRREKETGSMHRMQQVPCLHWCRHHLRHFRQPDYRMDMPIMPCKIFKNMVTRSPPLGQSRTKEPALPENTFILLHGERHRQAKGTRISAGGDGI